MADFDITPFEKHLDEIQPHTEYKTKYVIEYVKGWLRVACNRRATRNINFIDCMCNAGIYLNGVLGTPTEVLIIFSQFASEYKHIKFNLFLNDVDSDRINVVKEVLKASVHYEKIDNINLYFSTEDVNDYLSNLLIKETFFNYNAQAFTLLFVDPYKFGDVEILKLNTFLNKYRSELIYNYFISDYRRNINNQHAPNKQCMMVNSMKGIEGYDKDKNGDELLYILQENFKNKTNLKYTFAYPFHIMNNAKLYYIIYGTPHIAGIKQLKQCIWTVFNGDSKHRTKKDPSQITLFTDDVQKQSNEDIYSIKARELLVNKFNNQTVEYTEIEEFVICSTMLTSNQIIKNVLKPLINEHKVIKLNKHGLKDYKKDSFSFSFR